MGAMVSEITIVYSTVYSDADQRIHQSSASLAFVGNSPVTGEFPAQMASNAKYIQVGKALIMPGFTWMMVH